MMAVTDAIRKKAVEAKYGKWSKYVGIDVHNFFQSVILLMCTLYRVQ
jgi:hypothetical protein